MATIPHLSLLRFSIRQLLICTAFVALGCVALRSASGTWVAAMFAVTLLAFIASLLLLIFRQGADRAYWIGFSLVGWLYLLLLTYGWGLDQNTTYNHPLSPTNLITGRLSSWCYNKMFAPKVPQAVTTGSFTILTPNGAAGTMMLTGSADGGGSAMGSGMPSAPGPVSLKFALATSPTPAFTGPSYSDFLNVGQALWALLLAACGGWFAQWLYVTRPAAV